MVALCPRGSARHKPRVQSFGDGSLRSVVPFHCSAQLLSSAACTACKTELLLVANRTEQTQSTPEAVNS
eukprot:1988776-Amphidinium_carterae.1